MILTFNFGDIYAPFFGLEIRLLYSKFEKKKTINYCLKYKFFIFIPENALEPCDHVTHTPAK